MTKKPPHFVSLGMFIVDEFEFLDEEGNKTEKCIEPQVIRIYYKIDMS